MSDPQEVVGLVLAGGASRRMGRDKATLELDGESLAMGAARRLHQVCPQVLVADAGRGLLPAAVATAIPDGPGAGPAAGILGAAAARPGDALLVLACDLPAVPVALLGSLIETATGDPGADWVLPRTHRGPEPLCALYRPRALALLATRVAAGDYALHPLASEPILRVRFLDEDALRPFGDPRRLLHNLNTPEDLEAWR